MNATTAPTKFTRARFESVHADPPKAASAREARRMALRADFRPPALIRQEWRVVDTYCFWTEELGEGLRLDVPAGFEFDGASVPWGLTLFVPRAHPIYLAAAGLHDHLYAHPREGMSRARADEIFLDALLVSGVNWVWAGLVWRAVRAGGWAHWYRRFPDSAIGRLLTPWRAWKTVPVAIVTTALFLVGVLYDLVDHLTSQGVYRRYRKIRDADLAA